MKLFGLVLGEGCRWGGIFSFLLAFFQIFYTVFLFPKDILHLLVLVQEAIDADIGVVGDVVSAQVVGLLVAGRMVLETVEGDVFVQQDGIQGDHLFLGQVDEPFLDPFQFMDSALCRHGLTRGNRRRVGGAGLRLRNDGRGDRVG